MVFKALDDMASDYLSSMCTERSFANTLNINNDKRQFHIQELK